MKRSIKNIVMIIVLIILVMGSVFTIYLRNNTIKNNVNNVTMKSPAPPEKPNGEAPTEGGQPGMEKEGEAPPPMPGEDNSKEMENALSTPIYFYFIFGVEGLLISVITIYLLMSIFNKYDFKKTFSNKKRIVICILLIIFLTTDITLFLSKSFVYNELPKMPDNPVRTTEESAYKANVKIKESSSEKDKTYESTEMNVNALSIEDKVDVKLDNIVINKTGDTDNTENSSFYGINSALIARRGSTVTITNSTINTDADGANGIYSFGGGIYRNDTFGDGTTINVSNTKITTKKSYSGGIMTTAGGITHAKNLTIETSGASSAAIRTDNGGGIVTVEKGTYITHGEGSPAIYSTGEITVEDATLVANASEGVIIESGNKATLKNVDLTCNHTIKYQKSTQFSNIMTYRSVPMPPTSMAELLIEDSKVTTNDGPILYVTNSISKITLKNVSFTKNNKNINFLEVKKDAWGQEGLNGGESTVILDNQKIDGNIIVDEISTLDFKLKNNSSYEGTINKDNTAKNIKISLSKNSKIKLTGDSYITEFKNEDKTNSNIDFNGYKLYVKGEVIK